jgi:hypothetical protein
MKKELLLTTTLAITALAASWTSYGFAWPGTSWTFYSPYSLYADSPWLRASALFVVFLLVRGVVVLCRRIARARGDRSSFPSSNRD